MSIVVVGGSRAFSPGDNGNDIAIGCSGSDVAAVVAFVTNNVCGREVVYQCFCFHHIVTFATGQGKTDWLTVAIHRGVQFRAPAAAGTTERFVVRPPFAPAACW